MTISSVNQELLEYVNEEVIPLYDSFDKAHQRDHADTVIEKSLQLAEHYDVDPDILFAAAAYHDTGLRDGRERHHLVSGEIVRADGRLREWFSEEQIEIIAQAAEDHRASNGSEPRSIYGRIVAEADRDVEPMRILRRCVQFGLKHYPEYPEEEHWKRFKEHMKEKYDEGGYLHLLIPESDNAAKLAELREIIRDEQRLEGIFRELYLEETSQP